MCFRPICRLQISHLYQLLNGSPTHLQVLQLSTLLFVYVLFTHSVPTINVGLLLCVMLGVPSAPDSGLLQYHVV